jgi:hypothetical protein
MISDTNTRISHVKEYDMQRLGRKLLRRRGGSDRNEGMPVETEKEKQRMVRTRERSGSR